MLLLSARNEHAGWRYAATAVFVAASLTDRVDGAVARRRGTVTDFGKIADPIADKALIGAALISLSSARPTCRGGSPSSSMVREIGVTLLRFWVIRRGVIAASRGGKVKTVLQAVAIGLVFAAAHRSARVCAGLSHGDRGDRHAGHGCRLRCASGAVAAHSYPPARAPRQHVRAGRMKLKS